ncbi:trypsin-like serine peptidase [Kitasatospora indigofera]|uniref:trypsin-like serine peptidase n=1 Tax=Kitasatospora indigofera TaxID=67307 RepID=UPI00367E8497
MSNTVRTGPVRRRAALATASVLAVLSLAATACGPENSDPSTDAGATAAPTVAASASASGKPGLGLPTSLADLANWSLDDWAKFANDNILKNDVVKGFWDMTKMEAAAGRDTPEFSAQSATAQNETDPQLPSPIPAKPQAHPYNAATAVLGKLFLEDGKGGGGYCSATVVSDPANPGRSNLVYTASHCLHEGKGGKFFQKMTFVPSFNKSGAYSNGKKASEAEMAPYGWWAADEAYVSPQWAAEGGHDGGPVSQYDFGMIHVHNMNGDGKSLEETVGSSVPVWFNAPREQVNSAFAYGYPSAAPFDGRELEHCDSTVKPAKLSFEATRPTMYVIGCTMTPGSSGGGWFVTKDGKPALISVNSIGPKPAAWMAGPSLQAQAKNMFDYVSKKKR